MKTLEKYFIFRFIRAFAWCAAALVFFYLVFDVFERLNLILEGRLPAGKITDYYLNMIPLVLVRICPLAMLISAMFVLGSFAKNNEIIAAAACGFHPYRLFLPFLLAGMLASAGSAAINEKMVPRASARAHEIRFGAQRESDSAWKNRVVYDFSENRRFFIGRLDPAENIFSSMEITQFRLSGVELMKFQGRTGGWESGKWTFFGAVYRTFDDEGGTETSIYADRAVADETGWEFIAGTIVCSDGAEKTFHSLSPDFAGLDKTPGDFTEYQPTYEEMSYRELKKRVEYLEEAGFFPAAEIVALHGKITRPLACLVLVLIGISFSTRQKKGGALAGVGAAMGISLAYYLVESASAVLGESLPFPAMGAWLPLFVFMLPGIRFFAGTKYVSY